MRILNMERKSLLALAALVLGYCLLNLPLLQILGSQLAGHGYRGASRMTVVMLASLLLFALSMTFCGRRLRTVYALVFGISAFSNLGYFILANNAIDFDTMQWLIDECDQALNIVKSYPVQIIKSALPVLTGILLAYWASSVLSAMRAGHAMLFSKFIPLVIGLALVAWNGFLFKIVSTNHPMETSALTYLVVAKMASAVVGNALPTQVVASPRFEKVVLIVDESMRHDHFAAVMGAEAARLNAIDFGDATSLAPCSSASNAMMRWGYSPAHAEDPQFDARTNPKIWKYAQRAGFTTHLFDGQSTGQPQNFMGAAERAEVADFRALSAGIDTDKLMSRQINATLLSKGRDFLYVVKRGAHYSYESAYPTSMQPAITSRAQSYDAAIRYSSAGFFDAIFKDVDMGKVLLIYTSDHGQRLDGTGSSHCNSTPHRNEFSVPMLVFTGDTAWRAQLKQSSIDYHDQAWHAQIFPTLLVGLGFDKETITHDYAPTLVDAPGKRYVLNWPFKPFPNLRSAGAPARAVAHVTDIGPDDSQSDPAVGFSL